ncbi:hypothetical protein [Kribbella italica]|uniref:Uncharacterized protein n=1 Tax=Kribbella italica TaxID=1540520 RepID=A0A7W9MUF4_9ACTN|nr:hypothetical protein [Kribbella italica]MBB5836177.1 hypothetical protein [Kribbella italica]
MSEQDLIDQITTSAHRTDHHQLDPTTLIAAGRKRVRRRRAAAVTAAAGLVTLSAVAAISVGNLRTSAPQVAGPPLQVERSIDPGFNGMTKVRYLDEPMRTHLGLPVVDQTYGPAPDIGIGVNTYTLTVRATDGTTASLRLTRPISSPQNPAPDSPDVCAMRGVPSEVSDCQVMAVGSQSVRIGQRGDRAFFASTLRPDGTLILALFDRDGSTPFEGSKPMLFGPVDQQAVTALVTDPKVPSLK